MSTSPENSFLINCYDILVTGENSGFIKEEFFMFIPEIVKEGYQKDTRMSMETQFFQDRTIFLEGEITSESANCIVKQLLILAKESTEPINIYINSGGGSVNAGLLIYDVIQSIQSRVNIYVTGMAASMAAVLACCGEKGRRYILPHSQCMIHEPLINGGVGGSTSAIRNISESLLKTRELTNGIIAKHTGKSMEEVEQACSYDHYLDAEEAVEFGLVDEIVTTLL